MKQFDVAAEELVGGLMMKKPSAAEAHGGQAIGSASGNFACEVEK